MSGRQFKKQMQKKAYSLSLDHRLDDAAAAQYKEGKTLLEIGREVFPNESQKSKGIVISAVRLFLVDYFAKNR